MPSSEDFAITGRGDWLKLSKALKGAGRTGMRKQLHKGLRQAAKPLIKIDRAAALARLPKTGGLNERMARAPQRVRVKTGTDPGIALELPGKQPGYNDGVIRHPVFDRDKEHRNTRSAFGPVAGQVPWVEQQIDGTWFDDTLAASAPTVLPALERAVQDVIDQLISEAQR